MATTREQVGGWIRDRRDELGIPATRLAELIGISYQTMVNTEAGRSELKHKRTAMEDVLRLERGSIARAYKYGQPLRPLDIPPASQPVHPAAILAGATPREQAVLLTVLTAIRQQYGHITHPMQEPGQSTA